jgi:hypothetical protein
MTMTKWFCRKAAFAMNERWFDNEAGCELEFHERSQFTTLAQKKMATGLTVTISDLAGDS